MPSLHVVSAGGTIERLSCGQSTACRSGWGFSAQLAEISRMRGQRHRLHLILNPRPAEMCPQRAVLGKLATRFMLRRDGVSHASRAFKRTGLI